MTFMSWRKDYEVGVSGIDAEHQHLFTLINEYHDQCQGNASDAAKHVLNKLVAYAEEHFQHEETTMLSQGYPKLAEHQALHSKLFETIFSLNEQYAGDLQQLERETLSFLKYWLVKHILQEDMQIGDYLHRAARHADDVPAAQSPAS